MHICTSPTVMACAHTLMTYLYVYAGFGGSSPTDRGARMVFALFSSFPRVVCVCVCSSVCERAANLRSCYNIQIPGVICTHITCVYYTICLFGYVRSGSTC